MSGVRKESEFSVIQRLMGVNMIALRFPRTNASIDLKDEELETNGGNKVKELEILKSTQKKHQNSII